MNIGEWAIGHDTDGHLIRGYIEKMDTSGAAMVHVIASGDNLNWIVGKRRWCHLRHLKPLSVSNMTDTEGYLMNLIDFALDIGDELWFKQLTSELRKLKGVEPDARSQQIIVS